MSTPFIGEIRSVGFNFAPVGWAFCNGALQSIANNNALFVLIGTTYGGDGQATFGLPDLRGRVPIGQGTGPGLSNYVMGQAAGQEQVTLTSAQMPAHNHSVVANNVPGTIDTPTSVAMPAQAVQAVGGQSAILYTTVNGTAPLTPQAMLPQAIGVSGGSQPHANVMPLNTINFIIALEGIFPSQN